MGAVTDLRRAPPLPPAPAPEPKNDRRRVGEAGAFSKATQRGDWVVSMMKMICRD